MRGIKRKKKDVSKANLLMCIDISSYAVLLKLQERSTEMILRIIVHRALGKQQDESATTQTNVQDTLTILFK